MRPHARFLVVDDDAAFRTRLVKALAVRGYDARGAGNVDEAIDVARDSKPEAAVVDLRMPGGKSGLDLVSELVKRYPGIQIVILTGYGSIATAVEAVRQGAINYLSKPSDADQILAAFDHEGDGNGGGGRGGDDAVTGPRGIRAHPTNPVGLRGQYFAGGKKVGNSQAVTPAEIE